MLSWIGCLDKSYIGVINRLRTTMKGFLRSNKLAISTVVALIVGIGCGVLLRYWKEEWDQDFLRLVALPGDIYTRMLKMVVLPLIFPKLVVAVTSMEGKLSGKLGALLVGIYFLQNLVSQILSVIAAFLIKPGVWSGNQTYKSIPHSQDNGMNNFPISLIVTDLFKNMFPENIIKSMIFQTKSVLEDSEVKETNVVATNNLGMVLISIAFGFALKANADNSTEVIRFLEGLASAFTKIIEWIVNFGPFGILSLVLHQTLRMEDVYLTMSQMGLYIITILLVLFIHAWLMMPLVFFIITRRNPYKYMSNIMMEVISTVIGTSSSLAALPTTSRCLEEKNKVRSKVVRFALPLAITINLLPLTMISILFLMQLEGITPSLSNIVVMCIALNFVAVCNFGSKIESYVEIHR